MTQSNPDNPESDLPAQLAELSISVKKLNSQKFFQLMNAPWRALGFQFLRGIAFGLGSVLGATVVVSLVVYFLAQINFIPIIGEWAAQIAERIQQSQ